MRTILMLKFHILIILFIILRKKTYSSKNIYHKYIFKKTIIKLLYDWNFKKVGPSFQKILESLKNILGAGGWPKPNIFLITA